MQVLALHITRLARVYAVVLVGVVLVVVPPLVVLFVPPAEFPTGAIITVAPGTSVRHEAALLREAGYIRSTLVFRLLYRLFPNANGVQEGKYRFEHPVGELAVAWNLAHGVTGLPTVRLTFPEGTTVRQMGDALAAKLPDFPGERFKSLALPYEGYLFPDTYFFLPGTTPEEALQTMRDTFDVRTKDLAEVFQKSGHSERDLVIMASIVEGEGITLEDRRIIAGILWKRMSIRMGLQVDAPFGYIYGKTGYTPTSADLASNSAYNTYRYRGLPPTPINNPGHESLLAAATPTATPYLYYLTGKDGRMHYAKTFAEHVANKRKYL